MMGGTPPQPTGSLGAGVDADAANSVSGATPNPGATPPPNAGGGGFQLPSGLDLGNIMNA